MIKVVTKIVQHWTISTSSYCMRVLISLSMLINVVSGEVELAIMAEKTILSVSTGADVFKYLDLDTQLLELEAGVAMNEPVTYAVRKVIEASVVELIDAGEVKGLWSYKPEPWIDPGETEKVEEEVEELIEEIIEVDNEVRETVKEEVYDDYKKKPEVQVEEIVVEEKEPVIVEEPLSDAIVCESGPHHYRCYEDEKTNTSTDTTDSTDK